MALCYSALGKDSKDGPVFFGSINFFLIDFDVF